MEKWEGSDEGQMRVRLASRGVIPVPPAIRSLPFEEDHIQMIPPHFVIPMLDFPLIIVNQMCFHIS